MGKCIREYFSIEDQKFNRNSIFIFTIHFVCISIFLMQTGCIKNENNNQIRIRELPIKKSELNLNCTGYIETYFIKGSTNYFTIDTVEWLSGKMAEKAFAEDMKLNHEKTTILPDGYYIRNKIKDSLEVKVSDKAEVTMQTFSHNSSGNYNFNEKINIRKFLKLLSQSEFERFKSKLFKFDVIKDEIISIKEIYVP